MEDGLTTPQVYMKERIGLLMKALPCESYDLFVQFKHIDTPEAKPIPIRRTCSKQEFSDRCMETALHIDMYPTVFFRPNDCRYILLDDITLENCERIRRRFRVRARIETSPKNFQIWLYLNNDTPN